ncbi:MAG: acyltransferase [Chthonomonadaceae bacterium]|nr:acyltransferase [Chthonomonadaceae bacterium]
MFFLISGFILGLPFAAQHVEGGKCITLRDFYMRRLTRLEPPFIFCLFLCLGLAVVRLHKPFGEVFAHFLANLTYTHTLVYHALSPINPVLWSLEVEAQFYLLMPIFALIYRVQSAILRRALLIGVVLSVMLIYPFFFPAGNVWGRFTALFSLPCFLLGMLLADIYVTRWKSQPIASRLNNGVALLCVVAMFRGAGKCGGRPFADALSAVSAHGVGAMRRPEQTGSVTPRPLCDWRNVLQHLPVSL